MQGSAVLVACLGNPVPTGIKISAPSKRWPSDGGTAPLLPHASGPSCRRFLVGIEVRTVWKGDAAARGERRPTDHRIGGLSNPLLNRALRDEPLDGDVLLLPDPVGPVHGLGVVGWVPVVVVEDHGVGAGQIDPAAACHAEEEDGDVRR